jgi:hypothetical protein
MNGNSTLFKGHPSSSFSDYASDITVFKYGHFSIETFFNQKQNVVIHPKTVSIAMAVPMQMAAYGGNANIAG